MSTESTGQRILRGLKLKDSRDHKDTAGRERERDSHPQSASSTPAAGKRSVISPRGSAPSSASTSSSGELRSSSSTSRRSRSPRLKNAASLSSSGEDQSSSSMSNSGGMSGSSASASSSFTSGGQSGSGVPHRRRARSVGESDFPSEQVQDFLRANPKHVEIWNTLVQNHASSSVRQEFENCVLRQQIKGKIALQLGEPDACLSTIDACETLFFSLFSPFDLIDFYFLATMRPAVYRPLVVFNYHLLNVSPPLGGVLSIVSPDKDAAPGDDPHPSSAPTSTTSQVELVVNDIGGTTIAGRSVSSYPLVEPTRRSGDPICDWFMCAQYENRTLFCVADGCNWGKAPREAAQRAATTSVQYLQHYHTQIRTVQEAAFLVLRSCMEAHKSIFQGKTTPDEAGGTTILVGMLLQVTSSNKETEYAIVSCSIGDCKAFHYARTTESVEDITEGNRARGAVASDSGGRIGFYQESYFPDLSNIALSIRMVKEGDFIIGCSDGVHDNLDPEHAGHTPLSVKKERETCFSGSSERTLSELSLSLDDYFKPRPDSPLVTEFTPGSLYIQVAGAQDLAPMDKNGKSDPYCVVHYYDAVSGPKGKKHKTRVIFETLNPIWVQSFVYEWKDPDALFVFTVMDKDRYGSDDFEGEVEISALDLLRMAEVRDRCKMFKVNLALKPRSDLKVKEKKKLNFNRVDKKSRWPKRVTGHLELLVGFKSDDPILEERSSHVPAAESVPSIMNENPRETASTPRPELEQIQEEKSALWSTEEATKIKDAYRSKKLHEIITSGRPLEEVSAVTITQCLIKYCLAQTESSRTFMETNLISRLPKNYKVYPGKMDHTTCLTIRVGSTGVHSNESALPLQIASFLSSDHSKFVLYCRTLNTANISVSDMSMLGILVVAQTEPIVIPDDLDPIKIHRVHCAPMSADWLSNSLASSQRVPLPRGFCPQDPPIITQHSSGITVITVHAQEEDDGQDDETDTQDEESATKADQRGGRSRN